MTRSPDPQRAAARRDARTRQLRLHPLSYTAIAAAIVAGPAFGTGFQGNATFASGSGQITRGATSDVIDVTNSSTAVIDWDTFDTATSAGPNPTPITFLPSGNTATFQSSSGNFTVLNRIFATDQTRPIEFDGHVVSQIINGANAAQGGSVWFYAPGGIILGGGAVFDVGSLLLTTNAITLGQGSSLPNAATGLQFRGATDSRSTITVNGGARINANVATDSYVAIVAPRVFQNGNVQVNGSAGYYALEQADLTIANGLFDLSFAVGSNVGASGDQTFGHGGTTGGAAAVAGGDPHRVYMVAVPKNDAITMLVNGNIGYDAAASASVENGVIVLGAGALRTPENASYQGFGTPSASLSIGGTTATTLTSNLLATGNGPLTLQSGALNAATRAVDLFGIGQVTLASGGNLTIGGNATLYSQLAGANVNVFGGGALTVNGDVALGAGGTITATTITGGTLGIESQGATTINGGLTINADASYQTGAVSATGGVVTVSAHGANSSLAVAGALDISANGAGSGTGAGYSGTGGTVTLAAYDGGTLSAGVSTLGANGTGGSGTSTAGAAAGGTGTGGTVQITAGGSANPGAAANAGTIAFTRLVASAKGGGGSGDGVTAGVGRGGTTRVDAYSGSVRGIGNLDATGTGGNGAGGGAAGGAGTGGVVVVNAAGGNASLVPDSSASAALEADGVGGTGASGASAGAGGRGTGGAATLTVSNATVDCSAGGSCSVNAIGQGGNGGSSSGTAGAGGAGAGGVTTVTLTNGIVTTPTDGNLYINTTSTGGGGSVEGASTAGQTSVTATGNSQLATQGNISIAAVGFASPSGSATGGTVNASFGAAAGDVVQAGKVTLSTADIHLVGNGPVPAALNGTGGTINLSQNGGTVTLASVAATTGHYALVIGSTGQQTYVPVNGSPITGGGVNVALAGSSPLVVTGTADILHTANIAINAAGAGGLAAGGAFTINDAGALAIAHANPGGATIAANSAAISVGGPISAAGTALAVVNAASVATPASATLGDITAGGSIGVTAPGGIITGALDAGDAITLTASGSTTSGVTTGALTSGTASASAPSGFTGKTTIVSAGPVSLTSATSYGTFEARGSAITAGSIANTTGDLFLYATDGIDVTTLQSYEDILAKVTPTASSGGSHGIVIGTASFGDDILVSTPGQITATTIASSGALDNSGTDSQNNPSPSFGGSSLQIDGGAGVTVGTATATNGSLTSTSSAGDLRYATVSTRDTVALAAAGILDAEGISAGGAITASGASVTLAGPGALNVSSVTGTDAGGIVRITAGGDLTTTTGDAAGDALLGAGGAIAVDRLTSGRDIGIDVTPGAAQSGHAVTINTATAGDDLRVRTPGAVTATTLSSTATANGTSPGGPGLGGNSILVAGDAGVDVGSASTPLGDLTLAASAGNVALGHLSVAGDEINAQGGLTVTAGGTITIGDTTSPDVFAPGGIMLSAGQALTTGNLQANGSITAASTSGPLTLGNVESVGGVVTTSSGGDMTLGDVRAAGSIFVTGGGAITTGDLTAGTGPLLPGLRNMGGGTPGPAGIAAGFTQGAVTRCDDCNTAAIALPFTVNYFGQTYTTAYVSSNGYITFGGGSSEFTPRGLGADYTGRPIIAPFFADVDTGNPASAQATYGAGVYVGRQAFGATFNGVGYFDERVDKLNQFQVVLADRSDTGAGNFDIYYNYGSIQWETGEADSGVDGLGGTSAAVGYNAGTGGQAGTYYELPGSRVPGSFIDSGTMPLAAGTNDGVPGQLLFTVRNGQVSGGVAEPATIHVTNTGATGNAGAITLGNLSAEATEVHGAGQVAVGNVTVADKGSGAAAPGQPFATVLDATGGLITGDISGAGFVALGGGSAGDVSTGAITSGSSVAVLAGGDVSLGAVTTGANDTLFVAAPAVAGQGGALAGFDFDTLLSGKTFDPASLATATPGSSARGLTFGGPVGAGNVVAAAGTIGTGGIAATGRVSLAADRLLTIGGTVTGADIVLASSDIAVAGNGLVGGTNTNTLAITNSGEGAGFYGDASGASAGAYALDGGELARLQARSITLDSASGMTIGNVALHGETGLAQGTRANILGGDGTIAFTGGAITLVGGLDVSNLAPTNGVTLAASRDLTGVLPAAGIALGDGAGGLSGTLTLSADRIAFTTQSAADAIAAASSVSARSDRLGMNDGNVNPDGYVRAGTINLNVVSALYAQNSGADSAIASRAGFTAGAGGYHFTTLVPDPSNPTGFVASTKPVEVAFNGRQIDADGTLVAGGDLYQEVDIDEDAAEAVPGSTVNGCVIGATCTDVSPTETVPPIQDIVTAIINGSSGAFTRVDQSSGVFVNVPLVSFGELAPSSSIPLIDEPVTGSGNEDLWGGIGYGRDPEEKNRDANKPGAPAR